MVVAHLERWAKRPMTASEFASTYRRRLQELEAKSASKGFENIRCGIIEHSDVYEVVGYQARQKDPASLYDGLTLRVTFLSFPAPQIEFCLQWTSWMSNP